MELVIVPPGFSYKLPEVEAVAASLAKFEEAKMEMTSLKNNIAAMEKKVVENKEKLIRMEEEYREATANVLAKFNACCDCKVSPRPIHDPLSLRF